MPVIPYQEMIFQFGSKEQDVGERHVKVGNLLEASNVRIEKRLQYSKRWGFTSIAPSISSASGNGFTNTTDSTGLVAGLNGTMFTIDGAGRAWCYDPDQVAWIDRGLITRPFPQHAAAISAAKLARPTIVIAGNNKWTFAVTTDAYYYSVEDLSTGLVLQPPTKVTATGILNLCAAYDNTNVWALWVAGGTSATSHKYVNSTPTVAAVSATYITVAGTEFRTLDMQWLAGPSLLAVVLGSRAVGSGDRHTSRSYMNPATGQASGAPAAVTITDVAGANNQLILASPSILVDSSGTTNWYFCVWKDINSVANAGLVLYKVTTATLALAATTTVVSVSNTNNTTAIGACCGYVAANGDQVIYEHFDNLNVEPSPWNYVITKRVRGSVTTDTVWARGQWLASKPVLQSGTQWYVMTGYEDDGIALANSFQARGVQRTYNLRDASNGNVVGQALTENAGGLWHNTDTPLAATLGLQYPAKVPAAYLSGGKLYMAAMMAAGSLLDLSAGVIAWDFAPTYGYPAQCLDRALVPGGIPCIFSHQENVREVTPLNFPNYFTTSGGGTTYIAAVCYRFTSPDGTFWRSAPIIGSLSIANGATITVPTLRNLLPGTMAVIEWYAGAAGVAYLQEVKDNDPTVDSITFTFTNAASLVTDEALYTTGGALDNAPLPPCKHVAVFQNRVILAATPEQDIIWVSQEFRQQAGLQFNEALNSSWIKGSGEITGMAESGLFMSIHRRDATAIISGPGPDGNASGVFIPQTLDVKENVTNFRSLLAGEKGVFFQALDGLIYQLQGGSVVPVYSGMADQLQDRFGSVSQETVLAVLMHNKASQAWFMTTGSQILVLDFGHPTPEQPAGQWLYWSQTSYFPATPCGACVDSNGTAWILAGGAGSTVLYKQVEGQWSDISYFTTPKAILMRLRTGALAPWGLLHGGRVESVTFLGRRKGDTDFQMTLRTSSVTSSSHTKTPIPSTDQLRLTAKPPALNRVPEFDVTIEETANAGLNQGFIFDGLAVRFQDLGIMPPNGGETI
jgi:hypothetical protein